MLPQTEPSTRAIAFGLAAAGTLPFLGGLFVSGFADSLTGFGPGSSLAIVQVYAAVIASFVSGLHWAAALLSTAAQRKAAALLIGSNVAALIAWIAAILPQQAGFAVFALVFAALALIDRALWRGGVWPDWFWRLRLVISAVVTGACAAIAVQPWN